MTGKIGEGRGRRPVNVRGIDCEPFFSCVTGGVVGNSPPTLPAPRIGGVPHEELKKRWSGGGADFWWSGGELVEVFEYFFMELSQICWSGVLPNSPLITSFS
jgi:hypothetical protein